MGFHYLDDRNYLEPPEPEDPLEGVEYPRERKPWKRDRDAVRFAMQQAINVRCLANPMVSDSRGEPGRLSKDHSLRFSWLNDLHYELFRYRMRIGFGPRRSHSLDALARLHRIAELIPYFDKPRLP